MPKEQTIIGVNIKKYRNKIEAGSTPNPTIKTVKQITDALSISLDDLMK